MEAVSRFDSLIALGVIGIGAIAVGIWWFLFKGK